VQVSSRSADHEIGAWLRIQLNARFFVGLNGHRRTKCVYVSINGF